MFGNAPTQYRVKHVSACCAIYFILDHCCQVDEAAAVMTQLPPERAAALALTLPSGGALPAFHVQAIDAWGNATGPTDALPCDVTAACDALSPVLTCFSIPASGRAYVEGTLQFLPCVVMSSVSWVTLFRRRYINRGQPIRLSPFHRHRESAPMPRNS